MKKISNVYAWNLLASRGISSVGAIIASFTMDVWVYKTTGSYAAYALVIVALSFPPFLISPFAGYVTDRFNKAKILAATEIGTFLVLIITALLFSVGRLSPAVVASSAFLLATVNEFRYTAITALIPEITEKAQLISLGGLQQIFRGICIIIAQHWAPLVLSTLVFRWYSCWRQEQIYLHFLLHCAC